MKINDRPLVVAVPVITRKKTIFRMADQDVILQAPIQFVRSVIRLCDGRSELSEVIKMLTKEWEENEVVALLDHLESRSVLVNASTCGEAMWKAVSNPAFFPSRASSSDVSRFEINAKKRHRNHVTKVYPVKTSGTCDLLTKRRSTRVFSGAAVTFRELCQLAWCVYGETEQGNRTVPSAGALYPLRSYIVLTRQTGELQAGVYEIVLPSPETVGFNLVHTDYLKVIRSFYDPLMLERAAGFFVVCGSLEISSQKYGNRAMLYVPLEAGHAAQNVHLVAQELRIDTVEIGGFAELPLSRALSLEKGYLPLTTVAFGHAGAGTFTSIQTDWVIPSVAHYNPPFAVSLARVSPEINDDWSYGRDPVPSLAQIKAVSEAKEWAACGCPPRRMRLDRLDMIPTAVDPRDMIRFDRSQYRIKDFPFAAFDVDEVRTWTNATDEHSGKRAHVLADLVYFPYESDETLYAYANSSGVAAHPDRDTAVRTAVLELVERDSFMIMYLCRLSPARVRNKTLPLEIKARVSELEKIGFKVHFLDHTIDLAPTVCVFVQSEELGYTTCASCSSFDTEHAASHALMEVEASVLARLQNGQAAVVRPRKVSMPEDHGNLYDGSRYFRHADFMFSGKRTVEFGTIGKGAVFSWEKLRERIDSKGWRLITVPLSVSKRFGGSAGLHIIRAIIPGMVPMTFGYRQEPGGMDRIYEVAKTYEGRRLSYKDLTKFPHPFA